MASVHEILGMLIRKAKEKLDRGWILRRDNYSTNRRKEIWDLLEHMGIDEDGFNSLNIIHVAGTKGKGSTCTFIESILRENGIKTGLVISPHLLKATERICIDGKPITDERFVELFQRAWSGKGQSICSEYFGPSIYLLLFCMAIRAFIDDGVEVAIIEVGKGGEYDVTNIIPKPVVCAVTLLEIEHTDLLGDDIRSIAWHKSGIFKPGSEAFTIPQQKSASIVLQKRAEERGCKLSVVPDLSYHVTEWKRKIEIGLKGKHQSINASLAIEVCLAWMTKMGKMKPGNVPDEMKEKFSAGLKKASILGRNQIIERPGTSYCFDVAHTSASLKNALEWFEDFSLQKEKKINGKVLRILAFSVKEGKNLDDLIPVIQKGSFDRVIFPVCYSEEDRDKYFRDREPFRKQAEAVEKKWKIFDPLRSEDSYKRFDSVNAAVAWIAARRDEKIYLRATESLDGEFHDDSIQDMDHLLVFVTGSFKIVKEFLAVLPM